MVKNPPEEIEIVFEAYSQEDVFDLLRDMQEAASFRDHDDEGPDDTPEMGCCQDHEEHSCGANCSVCSCGGEDFCLFEGKNSYLH